MDSLMFKKWEIMGGSLAPLFFKIDFSYMDFQELFDQFYMIFICLDYPNIEEYDKHQLN